MFCKNCGAKMKDGEVFCPECGTKQDVPVGAQAQGIPGGMKPGMPGMKQGIPGMKPAPAGAAKVVGSGMDKKKIGMIAGIAAGVLAVIIIIILIATNASSDIKKTDFALYQKNGELYVNFLDNDESFQLTDDLDADYDMTSSTVFNESTGYLYFPGRHDDNDDGMTLYYVDLNTSKEKMEPVKLDSDITDYFVSDNGKVVYYRKKNANLYINDLSEKTKISSDVYYPIMLNTSGDLLIYMIEDEDEDGDSVFDYCTVNQKGEVTTLIEDASYRKYYDEENSIIALTKKDTIYTIVDGKTLNELTSVSVPKDGILSVHYADATSAYYAVYGSDELYVKDFVTDNKKSTDANIQRPDEDDQKYWKTWEEGFWGPEATSYTDEYYDALEQYEQKCARDDIRDSLDSLTISSITNRSLYYFNGTESVELAKYCSLISAEAGKIVYISYDISETKVDVADIATELVTEDSYYIYNSDICDYVESVINPSRSCYVAIGGNANLVSTVERVAEDGEENDEFSNTYFNAKLDKKGSAVYFLQNQDEDGVGDLYYMKISGTSLGEATMLYSDVSAFACDNSGNILTYRDSVKDRDRSYSFNDLYVNDTRIDTDVFGDDYDMSEIQVDIFDDDTLLYFTSYSASDKMGTLRRYNGKSVDTIAEDVYSYVSVDTNRIFYLADVEVSYYSDYSASGTLYCYLKGENIEIDNDVEHIGMPLDH